MITLIITRYIVHCHLLGLTFIKVKISTSKVMNRCHSLLFYVKNKAVTNI